MSIELKTKYKKKVATLSKLSPPHSRGSRLTHFPTKSEEFLNNMDLAIKINQAPHLTLVSFVTHRETVVKCKYKFELNKLRVDYDTQGCSVRLYEISILFYNNPFSQKNWKQKRGS